MTKRKRLLLDILTVAVIVLPILICVGCTTTFVREAYHDFDNCKVKNFYSHKKAFDYMVEFALDTLEQEKQADAQVDYIVIDFSVEFIDITSYDSDNKTLRNFNVEYTKDTRKYKDQIHDSFSTKGYFHSITACDGLVSFNKYPDGTYQYRLMYTESPFSSPSASYSKRLLFAPHWIHLVYR